MKNKLTIYILVAMVAGIAVGIGVNRGTNPAFVAAFAGNIKLLATIFIRLVQMIIAPLVFSTLVVGIAKLGNLSTVGRVGGKALLWFVTASLCSLLIGLFFVNLLKPGVGVALQDADAKSVEALVSQTKGFSFQTFIEHIIPKSVFEAMATNEILQLVIFSLFFGIASAALGDKAKPVIKALDSVSHIVLKMVGYVMSFAPFGVFGAIAGAFATQPVEKLLKVYANFFGSFLLGIAALWLLLILAGLVFLGPKKLKQLFRRLQNPLMVAFSTTSSEAVFPKLTEEMERFGCKEEIVAFILPLGYSFNLDGSMMYMTFASLFIAQAYGVDISLGTQLTMLLVLMLTSKGVAGVPRASLIVVAATCGMFHIPVEGVVVLILPIDHFCDMFRSATNVVGNALATAVVSKWEGELGETKAH